MFRSPHADEGLPMRGNIRLRNCHYSMVRHTKVEGILRLNIIVGEGTTILQLLAGKYEALEIDRDILPLFDQCLDIVDCARR